MHVWIYCIHSCLLTWAEHANGELLWSRYAVRAFFPSLRVALEGHFTILIGTIHKPNMAVNFYKNGRFSQFNNFTTRFFTILRSSRLNFSQFWKVRDSICQNFEKLATHFFTILKSSRLIFSQSEGARAASQSQEKKPWKVILTTEMTVYSMKLNYISYFQYVMILN